MSLMPLLLTLLMVAYIGSIYASGRRQRAFGSASGVEFLVLGALLGPQALGAVGRQAIAAFDPITLVALGWVGLCFGIEWGSHGGRRAPLSRIALGCAFTLVVGVSVGYAVLRVAEALHWFSADGRMLVSTATALVSAETTRHAVRWVAERHGAKGSLATLLGELAAADDAPVLIGLAALFAVHTGPLRVFGTVVPVWASGAGTLVAGAALGLIAALLTHVDRSTVTCWGVLLGCTALATGLTTSLGLSAMSATFALGLTLSAVSPLAAELRERVLRTQGSLLLPALLLSGARLELPHAHQEILLIGSALLARLVASCLVGTAIATARRPFRPAAPWLGFAMTSSGTLTMMVALAFSVRLGGDIGRFVLLAAAAGTLVGELLGPQALVRALARAGELEASSAAPAKASELSVEVAP